MIALASTEASAPAGHGAFIIRDIFSDKFQYYRKLIFMGKISNNFAHACASSQ